MAERLLQQVQAGLPLSDVLVIDAHAHLGLWHYMHIPEPDAGTMARVMERTGISTTIFSANLAIGPDYHMGNEMVFEAVKAYPGKFLGYVTVNPHYYEDVTKELDFWFQNPEARGRMVAIKMHPAFHQYPIDGEFYRPAFEYARDHGLLVLSHAWGEGPDELLCGPRLFEKVAREFPSVPIIVGHTAGNLRGYYGSVEAARRCPNLWLDTNHSFLSLGMVEFLVKHVGADRILFSTDFPFLNAPAGLGKVVFSKLSTGEKEKILGLNAKALFKLPDA